METEIERWKRLHGEYVEAVEAENNDPSEANERRVTDLQHTLANEFGDVLAELLASR